MTTPAAAIPSLSREYLWVPVTASGDDASQLTTLPVAMAFMEARDAEPADADWRTSSWADSPSPVARCLIGPGGGTVLADGTYYVWLRVTGAIEQPVRQAGKLKIT